MNGESEMGHAAVNRTAYQTLKLLSAHVGLILIVLLVVSVASVSNADAGDNQIEQKETLSFEVKGREIVLHNLAGRVEILPATDGKVSIEATIVAGGSNAADNLKLIELEPVENRQRIEIFTHYPVDEYTRYYYRSSDEYGSSNTQLRYQKRKVTVSSKRHRNALDLHVNYIVRLPDNADFLLTNAVGNITAQNVSADLNLDSNSGAIFVEQVRGNIRLDTGSGQIAANNVEGSVNADTGSGSVSIDSVSGDVIVDTGSGGVEAVNIGGELSIDTGSGSVEIKQAQNGVNVDTGSGSVEIAGLSGSAVVDTGSGSIDIERWQGGKRLDLDTGSGSVDVSGDFSRVRRLRVDTGSGGVRLITNTAPSLRLDIESSSGINVDLPDMSEVQSSRSRFRATVGGGEGDASISTGSGGVKFTFR